MPKFQFGGQVHAPGTAAIRGAPELGLTTLAVQSIVDATFGAG